MKKYKHIIQLLVMTAGLVVLGVFAFKYMHQMGNNAEVQIQATTTSAPKQYVKNAVKNIATNIAMKSQERRDCQNAGGC